jgi:hypothetical protein
VLGAFLNIMKKSRQCPLLDIAHHNIVNIRACRFHFIQYALVLRVAKHRSLPRKAIPLYCLAAHSIFNNRKKASLTSYSMMQELNGGFSNDPTSTSRIVHSLYIAVPPPFSRIQCYTLQQSGHELQNAPSPL